MVNDKRYKIAKGTKRYRYLNSLRLYLLVGSQFKQAIGGLQAKVDRLQEDLGDGEAGHVGGN